MSDDLTRAVLLRAAELIEPEGAWTQGAYARDAMGEEVPMPSNPGATCWCLEGAIWQAEVELTADFNRDDLEDTYDIVFITIGAEDAADLTDWNDHPERTQAEVVQALRDAAARVTA